jgi:dTDP-4-amino-4,6-dideoxygalactose transaminase
MPNPIDRILNVFQPSLGEDELEAVRRVFQSNWVGKGEVTSQFEAAFSHHLGVDRTLIRSVACCTEALFQSMRLLALNPGDEVVMPTISFVGAGNAVAGNGLRPVFCDVDSRTLNPTAKLIEECLTPRSRAVLILHYGGVPCAMDEIVDMIRRRDLLLIEDSACSVASSYDGRACGTFGDVGAWSFDAMKLLVTGDGGMMYCRTPDMSDDAEKLLYLGLTQSSGYTSAVDSKWWEFEISSFGRRAIMNDIASAIGLEQLKKLASFIDRNRNIHETYNRELANLDWIELPPPIPERARSSYYLYWIQMAPERRDRLAHFLRTRKIYTTFRYYPLHWVKLYGATTRLPNAEQAANRTLCLPLHPSLSASDVTRVVESVQEFGRTI